MAAAGGHGAQGRDIDVEAKVAIVGGCWRVNEETVEDRRERGRPVVLLLVSFFYFIFFSWRGCLEFFPSNFTIQLSLHVGNY